MEERVEKHIYQYVEAELYKYPIHKKTIQEYDKELMYVGAKSGMDKDPTGRFSINQTGDSTSSQTMRILAMEDKVDWARKRIVPIDDVLELLGQEERRLVELKYFQGWLSDYGVCRELFLSRPTYYRKKAEVIKKFAVRYGILA